MWLIHLSSAARVPAPGGAAAALHAAQGAALLAMVARCTAGEKYAEHAAEIAHVTDEADQLRRTALTLAEDDARAVTAVTAAYKLPHADDAQQAHRSAAIAEAVVQLLDAYGIALAGRTVAVVGRSTVVGKPLAHLLLDRDATVTVCPSRTAGLRAVTARAGIVVAAAGASGRSRRRCCCGIRPGLIVRLRRA